MVSMTNTKAIALLDSIVDDFDFDFGPSTNPEGRIWIYQNGTIPPNDVDSGLSTASLLAVIVGSNPMWDAAQTDGTVGAKVNLAATTDESSATAGTAHFARFVDRNENALLQVTVGAGSGELSLNTISIGSTAVVSINTCVLRLPDGGT